MSEQVLGEENPQVGVQQQRSFMKARPSHLLELDPQPSAFWVEDRSWATQSMYKA